MSPHSATMSRYRRMTVVDGIETQYFDAGSGDTLVLLHGGEFGACAQFGWEYNFEALATRFRVLAPDWLGFGGTAKVMDFVDGKGRRLRHMARFCEQMGVDDAVFVGNSMGGAALLADAASAVPRLPARKIVSVCGGGPLLKNEAVAALFDYDGSIDGMRALLDGLFVGRYWTSDPSYLHRRHQASIAPGAWEAVAAARFRRPGAQAEATPQIRYPSIAVPLLVVEGGQDKLKPAGWAREFVADIPGARSAVVECAGHCPQIEQPSEFHDLLTTFADQ